VQRTLNQPINLPNTITALRVLAAPVVAALTLWPNWGARLGAFVLFLAAAITDYWDGKLARSRGLVTDLGRLLDPLADKLLLLATFVPMFILQAPAHDVLGGFTAAGGFLGLEALPFRTPLGLVPLPFWVVAVVLGRELFMTVFRQAAVWRGVIIAAIGPAKWKTGFQWTWVGTALFWFSAALVLGRFRWPGGVAGPVADFIGVVGTVAMCGAVVLTIYSFGIYIWRYGMIFVRPRAGARQAP
jgi:CDP-diacylglycerol---glycerol-3-phosphate 3-phosphatidyltransferase